MLNISPQEEINDCLVDYFIYGDEAKVVDIFKTIFGVKKNTNYTEKIITWDNWDFSKYPDYSSLMTAKGCIFNCSFCFESKIFNRTYEKLNMNYVIENIKFLINKKNINKFAIEDSSFLSNSDFEYFCDMVLKNKLNIHWSAYGRVDQILKYKSYLPKLYQAGCTNIILGVESSQDEILKEMNKNCTSANTMEAINLLKKNKIGIQGCFILGFTGSTYKDIEETIDFGLDLNLNAYRWHIFQPNASNMKGANLSEKISCHNDYLKIQLNVPDFCLPEMLKSAHNPDLILTEEHFLIRAIPYLDDKDKILSMTKHNDLLFSEIFRIIKSKLSTRFKNFNEEEMYKLI